MKTIPLSQQQFPPDHVATIEARVRQDQAVNAEDLVGAIEQQGGRPMPPDLKGKIGLMFKPAKRLRGRPPKGTVLSEAKSAASVPLQGERLLAAIERAMGCEMPSFLRAAILDPLSLGKAGSGRPVKPEAWRQFALLDVDESYPKLLHKHREEIAQRNQAARAANDILPRRDIEETASARAYQEILERQRADFGPITWQALRNLHTMFKNGTLALHETPNEDDDFDALLKQHGFDSGTNS